MDENRKEKILHLEKLAQEVLQLKNVHRQRRPIIIEFCGCPKAGKTSSITSLNIFLKRNGFKTSVLTERASICPISDKQSPNFNVWTCTSTINEINERIDESNALSPNGSDIIICDRGIFDALCWFNWLTSNNRMSKEELKALTDFATLYRWQKNIDLVYIFLANPEESIHREYANLLTDKRGSIMRENVLKEYREAVKKTVKEYESVFRTIKEIDTTNRDQNDVGYEVTRQTLMTLKDMLMERIGYFPRGTILSLQFGLNPYSSIQSALQQIAYDARENVEGSEESVQPIVVAAILSKDGKKILCIKKNAKNIEKTSPEYEQNLLYIGGHMRKEDESYPGDCIRNTLKHTLERELYEELGLSISVDAEKEPFVIYTPNSEKSKRHIAIGWLITLEEDSKLRLDAYELTQKRGNSKSGTFVPIDQITEPEYKLEEWSRTILLSLLSDKLSESQKTNLKEHPEQLYLFN